MARKVRERRAATTAASGSARTDFTSLIIRISDQIAEKGIYAILLIVPLAFLPNAYWPFDIPKVTLIRILTILVLCAYLSRNIVARELKIIRPPVVWPILIYVAVYALSSIFSISTALSLYSGEGRNYGLFSLVNMVVLYFLVINIMTRRSQLEYCLKLLMISSTIVALLGLAQFYDFTESARYYILLALILVSGLALCLPLLSKPSNKEPRWKLYTLMATVFIVFIILLARKAEITDGLGILSGKMGDRASSTFGNPDFLISFLIIPFVLAYGYLFKGRWIYAVPLFFFIYCIIVALPFKDMGDYRLIIFASCYLLLIPIAVIYTTSRFNRLPVKLREFLNFAPRKYLPYAIVIISLLPIVIVGAADIFDSHAKISKFTRHHIAGEDTDRSMLVEIALDSFSDYPILGSGPNTYRNTFTVHAGIDYAQLRSERREDKVHNSFVEAISTTGILGFLAYLFMWLGLFWFFIKWLYKNRKKTDFIITGSIFIAGLFYVLHTIFIFHTTTPFTFFWIVMAIGMVLATRHNPQIKTYPLKISSAFANYSIIAILVLSGFGLFMAVRPLVANVYYLQAERIYSPQYPQTATRAIPKYKEAISWFGSENRYRWSLSIALMSEAMSSSSREIREQNCAEIYELMEESVSMEPESAMLYYNRAIFKLNCGASLEEVLDDANKSIDMYPSGYMLYRFRADLYSKMGRLEEAIADDTMSLLIKPGNFDSHLRMGNLLIALGDKYASDNDPDTDHQEQYEKAVQSLEQATTIKPKDVTAQYLLAVAQQKAGLDTAPGEWDKAINMLQQQVDANPNDIEAHYMLGVAYESIGDLQLAREQYLKVIELNPQHQQAISALNRLDLR